MEQNIVETPFMFQAWAWAEKNRKPLTYGIVGVAVAGLVIGYTVWSKKQQEIAAGQALSRAFYEQATGRIDATAAVEAMMKVATANLGTPAGGQALLMAGSGLFNSGKYAEAQAAFERFKREYSGSPLTAQAIYGVGAALAAQGKFDEAARAYKESADRYPQSPVAMQAQYSMAAALAAQGKLEEALPLYEKVAGVGMGNSLGNEAALRAEELRAKLPPPAMISPVTPATITTNTAPGTP
jgi:outer membrane protein assembly factor BamD (BamD/ComL family)